MNSLVGKIRSLLEIKGLDLRPVAVYTEPVTVLMSKKEFNDEGQIKFRNICSKSKIHGKKWMMSNFDVKVIDTNVNFFDEIYLAFSILRVKARRNNHTNLKKKYLDVPFLSGISVSSIHFADAFLLLSLTNLAT